MSVRKTPGREPARNYLTTLLRDAIDARRLSAKGVAKACAAAADPVDARDIVRWMKGEKTITLATADRIAFAIGFGKSDTRPRRAPAEPARVASPRFEPDQVDTKQAEHFERELLPLAEKLAETFGEAPPENPADTSEESAG